MRRLTPEQAADFFAGLGGALRYELDRAMQDSLDALVRAAANRSRGSYTEADLRRMGHPYARRRAPGLDPDLINRRTGGIEGGWQARGPTRTSNGVTGEVWNRDPKAPAMEEGLVAGRPIMHFRQPHRGALQDEAAGIADRFDRAVDEALEP